ncbi:site-specific DNA-methyltransferase [Methylocystis sp. JR02]|uniref:DNA-methyltransferase n=1 Tax=Methylocystis sp. JR02 TaxID=3046284 RepID=UPI0024B952CC|nr:site-specific DNA-methyltransferase [Methylocystis sp. JR02]MDJ0449194.1 site-specific DNA-methyltransferase [Methylocystis sp. JR02]
MASNATDVQLGDCLEILKKMPFACANLVYLDPPFFSGRNHRSSTRDGGIHYSFEDVWSHSDAYLNFLVERLAECKRIMKEDASIFVHCDHNNVHLARQALDITFGADNFQSDIIWSYKRWSNSKRGLLQQHQTILFYSMSRSFKWRQMMVDYSATTNLDQIMQKRMRDSRGKSVYATDASGNIVYGTEKRGVPLGDVWDIPFLNPKAKERTGYPTQKPLLLLERIIDLTTDENDLVVDPFCGSGTTLVAAKLKNRRFFGIDVSPDAVALTNNRLDNPIRTESALLRDGVEAYTNNDPWVESHLAGLSYSRVQRNSGIDALSKESINGRPVFLKVQRETETLSEAVFLLKKALATKGDAMGFVVATADDFFSLKDTSIEILLSPAMQLKRAQAEAFNDIDHSAPRPKKRA